MSFEIVQLSAAEAEVRSPELAEILVDVVNGGASVSFMLPFGEVEAIAFWQKIFPRVADGDVLLLAAILEGQAVGTVQLHLSTPPNQDHRADVAKLLVHRRARRLGVARALMQRLELEAVQRGRSLLTLDTMTDSPAERLYLSLGFTRIGVIPDYARWPDGPLGNTSFFFKDLGH